MRIGLLLCDHVDDTLITQHGDYPEMFANLFKQIDSTLNFSFYDALNNQLPKTVDECDAYLITGSQYGVNDGLPWVDKLENFILQVYPKSQKIIGICFGHQLVVKALGGEVIQSPKGWGVGMSVNAVDVKKSWMQPYCDKFNLLVSHQDQAIQLPKEAEVLASSDFCPYYMLQIGNNILTVQGHPEFSKAYSKALIEKRKAILEKRYETGLLSLQLASDHLMITQWIVNFLKN